MSLLERRSPHDGSTDNGSTRLLRPWQDSKRRPTTIGVASPGDPISKYRVCKKSNTIIRHWSFRATRIICVRFEKRERERERESTRRPRKRRSFVVGPTRSAYRDISLKLQLYTRLCKFLSKRGCLTTDSSQPEFHKSS